MKEGLQLTFRHILQARRQRKPIGVADDAYFEQQTGIMTLQYPREELPVPDNGRYKLHNEIDDCIVCDKCAKVCPVDCIDIEPVRATESFGNTSDGTPKRIYAAKFDIDMSKCCFCGLCTTVCPTECLTMTPEYDFSTFEVAEHNFPFATMSPLEILEKQQAWDAHQKEKAASKAASAGGAAKAKPARPKPAAARPKPRPAASTNADAQAVAKQLMKDATKPATPAGNEATQPKKPAFKPKAMKPKAKPNMAKPKVGPAKATGEAQQTEQPATKPAIDAVHDGQAASKPVYKPKMMKPKAAAKPKMKAVIKPPTTSSETPNEAAKPAIDATNQEQAAKKPVYKPKMMKPKIKSVARKKPEGGAGQGSEPQKPVAE